MKNEEIIRKIKEKEKFTEEIEELVWESGAEEIEEIEGNEHRWTRDMSTILKVGEYYIRIDWRRGLTECQENEYYNQPYFVEEKRTTKTIEVVKWEKLREEK